MSSPRRRISKKQIAAMKRLYLQFYLTIVASLAERAFEIAGEVAAAAMPPADAPREAQQRALTRLAERLRVDLALFDAERKPIAAAGKPLPAPGRFRRGGDRIYGMTGPAWSIRLPDRRW